MRRISSSQKKPKNTHRRLMAARRAAKVQGPPEQAGSIACGWRQRYTCTGLLVIAVTRQQLWNSIVTATTATVGYSQISAIKVNRIRCWGPTAAAGSYTSINLTWFSLYSPAVVHTDTGIGADHGAYVDSRPPRGSLAGEWSMAGSSTTEEVFGLNAPTGTVIDVDYSVRFQNTFYGAALPASVTLVGATPGTMYVMALDYIIDGATAVAVPVGATTIT